MGITAGFSRNTPHDSYFFDHPDEIIAGAIPPPKFNLRNLEAIGRHIRSLILELAELDFKPNLELYLADKGSLIDGPITEILDKVKSVGDAATATALKLWSDIDGVTEAFSKGIAEKFPLEIKATLAERGQLWQLELREQEDIWFVNHGLKDVRKMAEERSESPGFPLCPVCGDYFKPADFVKKKSKKSDADEKDSRSLIDAHAKRCTGKIKNNPGFALGHQLRADTLRLVVPNISAYGDEAVKWAWSFVYATIQGAVRLFEIDPEDIEAYVLTKVRKDEDGKTHQEVLDILWIDRIVGGSGVLHRFALNFPKIAKASLDHLAGHDCPNSCYRCLRSYRNQWYHKMLDWRLIVPYLSGVTGEHVELINNVAPPTPATEDPEWAEARAEGCESPQELNLLKAIRANGSLPEPEKQLEVFDQNKVLTRADFAYTDCIPKLLIYVDGLAFHSEVRQRVHDNRITNRLQMLGYRVLRFLGTETHQTPDHCVHQIEQARNT